MWAVVCDFASHTVYVESESEWYKECDDLVNCHTDWFDTEAEADAFADTNPYETE